MKHCSALRRAAAVTLAATLFLASSDGASAYTAYVSTASANIRAAAGTGSAILMNRKKGQTVEVTGEAKGSDGNIWYAVTVDDKSGYIRSDLVSKTAPASTPSSAGGTRSSGNIVAGNWQAVPERADMWYYVDANGNRLTDCFSSDSYYVDSNGARFAAKEILGARIGQRNSWMTAHEAGGFDCFVAGATVLQNAFNKNIDGARAISVYSNHVMLRSVVRTDNSQTTEERLALYKNDDINGYTIMVRTSLGGDRLALLNGTSAAVNPMPEYDYGTLRFFTNMVSRCGDKVAAAIYSSWEDNNEYDLKMGEWIRVGDTMIRYMPTNGAGLYEIKAAF
ncbi:MAG: SH3 domain-containing protein [Lachnospiraceae bacterium]|nr:SH3 domain-containing protein [Lachnospiraceae bacterium]